MPQKHRTDKADLWYTERTARKDTAMINQLFDQAKITADSTQKTKGGLLLSGAHVTMDLPTAPRRYLYSGWQSWSLTAWIETRRPVRPLRPSVMHARETDPVYVREQRPNGSWYGAVELADGKIIFLGALGLESHVMLDDQTLKGWYEEGNGESPKGTLWFIGHGDEAELLDQYAHLLKERFGAGHIQKSLRVWCSWYSLYTEIHEDQLLKILHDLGDMPFDVFQIDDGWQKGVGNWEPNAKFPEGMEKMAARIHETGRKAGLWLAPLLISPCSDIFREHRDWLLHDEKGRLVSAGYNWGDLVYALDTTHPEALEWLAALMKKVRAWGYDYAKLDFLYAGGLPGKRHRDIARESAYRNGLKTMRTALGDAYLLVCGSPILPSLGLCDGMRIGQDVGEYWDSRLFDNFLINFGAPGVRNVLRNTTNRLWLQPLVHTDPDVVYFRSRRNNLTPEQKSLLQDMAQICNFKATSDIPAWLTESEQAALRVFLESSPRVLKKGRTSYEIDGRRVDFGAYIGMPPLPGALTNGLGSVLGRLANIPALMKIVDKLDHSSLRKKLKQNPV